MATASYYLPILFFLIVLNPSACSVSFQFLRFDPNTDDMVYQGDAVTRVGAIELINNLDYVCRVGWATYGDRIPLWDPDTRELADFNTRLSFSIDTQGSSNYGHGLVFFLAADGFQMPPNSDGGFLGLFNTTTAMASALNQIVTVEFDLFNNPEWDPLDVNAHVGINNNSIASVVYTRWNASFHSRDIADVRINYNASTKNLSVSWSYRATPDPRENTSLHYIIDLMKVLPESVKVGFSGATGSYGARHTIESWEFHSSLDRKMITNGVDAKRRRIIIFVTVSGVVLIAAIIVGLLIMHKQRIEKQRKTVGTMNLISINEDLERGTGPKRFSYGDLVSATNNFSNDRKLGEGGFGAVFKGYLIDLDVAIAVKKISRGSKQGRKEYVTEVKTISQLRHRNLVQLIGWCHDQGDFLVVYEYLPNGSLDSHLFSKKNHLTWVVRYQISLGLASALLYLHEEWEQCVVHRDIKSSNIMLDSNFNARLGDFGLARLMDHELGPQTTGLAGTLGYMAPEYITTCRASKESDVYSFGVVALEIATGKKARDPNESSEMGLVEWVWDLYGKGKLLTGADEKLDMDYDKLQVECLMIVGLWCAHPDHGLRPSIRQAIQVLNFETALPNLPAKMPVPVYQAPIPSSLSSNEPFITNSSMVAGR